VTADIDSVVADVWHDSDVALVHGMHFAVHLLEGFATPSTAMDVVITNVGLSVAAVKLNSL
jgi:hypothetical protein